MGPDEPHAASTTWPDGIIEKQDLDLMDPQIGSDQITSLEDFLASELPSHPKLYRGQLNNGLRYLILPNKIPANRYITLVGSTENHVEILVWMFKMPG